MRKPRCGQVTFLSGAMAGDGSSIIHIGGKAYCTHLDREKFPVRVGALVEHMPEGKYTTITALQAELLEVRTSGQPLFDNNQLGQRGLIERRKAVRR
jgi:hypothetical protein